MERICEPELMDEPAQALAYAEADFAASDQAMVERLVALFGGVESLGDRIVDLGCGPGNITFRLAAACPAASLLGIDGARAMLALATQRRAARQRAANEAPGGPDPLARVGFRHHVLPDPALAEPPLGRSFTAVVSNSLLHHLHDPAVLWCTVLQLGAPGAAVYLQDLRRPASEAALEALVASEMAAAPAVLRRDYRLSLHAAFTPAEVAAQLERAGLGGLRVQPRDGRYLEVWGRLPLTASGAA